MTPPPAHHSATPSLASQRARSLLRRLPPALCALLAAGLLSSCLLPKSKQGGEQSGAVGQYREDITNFIVPGEEQLLLLADAGNDPTSEEVEAVYQRHYESRIQSALNSWGNRQVHKLGYFFDENFSMDSSLNWTAARGLRGSLEAVVPLRAEKDQSWFLQPGTVIWEGARGKTRRDYNIGIVHRRFFPTWRLVFGGGKILGAGAGVFYDYSAAHGLSRIGLGFDMQDEYNYYSAQFYTPVQGDWRDSEEDYQERLLSGMELFSRTRITRRLDVIAAFTTWRRYDELTGRDRGFGPGLRGGIDWKITRGLSLETNYDQSRTGGDNRWQVNLNFTLLNLRLNLPASHARAGQRFNLWRAFEREQRVRYAERRVQMRVTAPDVQAGEGDGNATLQLQLEQSVDDSVVGRVIPRSGSGLRRADAGDDFDASARDFTIVPGATGAEVDIAVIDDDEVEYDETFYADIRIDSAPSRVVAGDAATVTIYDNDDAATGRNTVEATLSAQPQSVAESAGDASVTVTAELSKPAPRAAEIRLTFAAPGGRATLTEPSEAIKIAREGQRGAATFILHVLDNTAEDGAAVVTIGAGETVGIADNGVRGTQVTIDDDDPLNGAIAVAGALRENAANDGSVGGSLTLTLSGAARFADAPAPSFENAPQGLTPQLTRDSGTLATLTLGGNAAAHAGADSVADFALVFGDDDFRNARASNVSGARAGNLRIDFIDAPLLRADAAALSVREGASANITLRLERASAGDVAGVFTLADGGAVAGTDYTAPAANARAFRIPAGATSTAIRIDTIDNGVDDGDRVFTLTLVRANDNLAMLGAPASVTVTITDDEGAPRLNASPAAVTQTEGGEVIIAFRLSHASGGDMAGAYEFVDSSGGSIRSNSNGGSARNATAADYTTSPAQRTFAIAAGQTSAAVTITLMDDDIDELDETLTLRIVREDNATATLGNAESVITIIDNDDTPLLQLAAASLSVNEGETAVAAVNINRASSRDIRGVYSLADGTATANSDYIVPAERAFTIAAGARSANIEVETREDQIYEGDETFTLTIAPAPGESTAALGAAASAQITIADDDRAPLAITPAAAGKVYGAEDPALQYTANFTGGDTAASVFSANPIVRAAGENAGAYAYRLKNPLPFNAGFAAKYGASLAGAGKFRITPKPLGYASAAASKVYDGTQNPPADFGGAFAAGDVVNATVNGVAIDDTAAGRLALSGGIYADADAGDGKAITGVNLAGVAAPNYTLNATVSGDITRREITYASTNAGKVYDDTQNPPAGGYGGGFNAGGVIAGDAVFVQGGQYAGADAGAGVAISGFALGGADSGNYALASASSISGAISKRPLRVTASGSGNTAPSDLADRGLLVIAAAANEGLAGDDTAAQVFTGALAIGSRTGNAAPLTRGSLALNTNSPGKNYTLDFTAGSFTFGALQMLAITPAAASKVYGMDDPATPGYSADFIDGDTAANVFSATPFERAAGENAGAYAYQLKNPPPFNADFAAKYSASLAGTNSFRITPKPLGYASTTADKVYDGTRTRPLDLNGAFSGIVAATINGVAIDDTAAGRLAISGGAFADKAAGDDKTIGGITLTGAAAPNYTLNAAVSGDIGKRRLRVTASGSGNAAPGDLSDRNLLVIGAAANEGLVGGDTAAQVFTGALAIGNRTGNAAPLNRGSLALNAFSPGGNYTLDFTPGEFTFTALQRLAITLAATAMRKVYGEPDPAIQYSANFGAGDDADSVFSESPFERAAGENAGDYAYRLKSPLPLNPGFAAKYGAVIAGASTLTIEPRPLRYASTAANKVYDRTRNPPAGLGGSFTAGDVVDAAINGVRIDDTAAGRLVLAGGAFADKRAGDDKAITGITLAGDAAPNYALNAAVSGDITPKEVTYASTAANKVYDSGNTAPAELGGDFGANDIIAGDSVLVQGGNYAGADAGAGIAITGFALGGADSGNYALASVSSVSGAISKRPLRVSASGNGDTAPGDLADRALLVIGNAANEGLAGGDAAAQVFTGALAIGNRTGNAAPLTRGSLALNTNTPGKNYTLHFTAGSFTFGALQMLAITPAAASKVYGMNDPATLGYSADFIDGDTAANVFSAHPFERADGENAGVYAYRLKNPPPFNADFAAKYSASLAGANSFRITRKPLRYTSTAADKVYNGTQNPPADLGGDFAGGDVVDATVNGVAIDDTATGRLALSGGVYAGKNAGTAKVVSGITLAGAAAANYVLSADVRGDITRKEITYTSTNADKVYDDTNTAPAELGGSFAAGGIIGSDSVLVQGGQYAGADAGAGVAISGFALGGAGAGNYALASASSISGAISQRPLRVTARGNGDTAPSASELADHSLLVITAAANEGLAGDDTAAQVFTGALAIGNRTGNTAPLTRGSLALNTNTPGKNYTLNFTAGDFIFGTLQMLSITPAAASKAYGMNDPATLGYSADFIDGDTAANVFSAHPFERAAGENAGVYAYQLKISLPFNAAFAAKYDASLAGANSFRITPKPLGYASTTANKVYDGTRNRPADLNGVFSGTVAATINGVAIDDTAAGRLAVSGGTFGDKTAGDDKEITGITLTGYAAPNYTLNATVRGDITPKEVTYASTAANKVYDSANTAPADLGGDFAAGDIIAGDSVLVQGGQYASANAGAGIAISGFALGGANSGNYALASGSSVSGGISKRPLRVTASGSGGTAPNDLTDRNLLVIGNAANEGLAGGDTAEQVFTGALAIGARTGGAAELSIGSLAPDTDTPGKNYTLDFTPGEFTFTALQQLAITPAAARKVYGGADPAIQYGANFDAGDDAGGVFGALPVERIAGENAGDYAYQLKNPVPFNPGFAAKYSASLAGANMFAIDPKALRYTSTEANKTYDGDDTRPADLGGSFTAGDVVDATINGVRIDDTAAGRLELTGGVYADKNAGAGKEITGAALAGSAAANYALSADIRGEIEPRPVAVAAVTLTKQYDAGGAVTGAAIEGGEITNQASGEILALQIASGSDGEYASADAGGGIAINNLSGEDFAIAGGNAASIPANYALPATISASGVITPKPLGVSAVTLAKVYDATDVITGATFEGGEVSGAVDGQGFTLQVASDSDGEYESVHAGDPVAVENMTAADFALAGADAASKPENYALPADIEVAGRINRRMLRVSASGAAFTADPSAITLAAESGTAGEGLVAPHALSETLTGAPAIDADARSGNTAPIVIGTLAAANSAPGSNYQLAFLGGEFTFHALRLVEIPGDIRISEGATGAAREITLTIAAGGLAVTPQFAFGESAATAVRRAAPADLGLSAFAPAAPLAEVAADASSFTLALPLADDRFAEGDEALKISISGEGVAPAAKDIIIADDESATIAFGNDAAAQTNYEVTVAETQATLALPVTISNPPAAAVTFMLVAAGDAEQPADYAIAGAHIAFTPDGAKTQNLEIAPVDDDVFEPDKHILLSFADSGPGGLGGLYARANTADITLASEEAAPALSLAEAALQVTEGETAAFALQLSGASARPVHATYALTAGSAAAGADYANESGTFTIAAGETGAVIRIATIDDEIDEVAESFTLTIALAEGESGAELGAQAEAVVTILDNDTPKAGFETLAQRETEGDDGARELQLRIAISPPPALSSEILVSVNPDGNDTAAAGADYVAPAASVALPAGAAFVTVALQIIGDTEPEPDETFRIALRAPDGAPYEIDAAQAVAAVTIAASDFLLNFASAQQIVPESAGTFSIDVALSHALDADFTGSLSFAAASAHGAAQPDDYTANATFTIAAGETAAAIPVTLIDDNAYEFSESARITLLPDDSRDVGVGLSGSTEFILQDDDTPSIALLTSDDASAARVAEGEALGLRVNVLPAGIDLRQRDIDFAGIRIAAAADADAATRDALSPADYTAPALTHNPAAPHDERVRATLQIAGDEIYEGDEVFVASLDAESLRSADGALLFAAAGKERVVVTIADEEAAPVVALGISPESINDESARQVVLTATSNRPAGYTELHMRIPVEIAFTPPNVASPIGGFVLEIPPGADSASAALTVTPTFDVGGRIEFAITDAIENAAKGAGATLAIAKGLARLQVGEIVAANGLPITEGNHEVLVPLSLTRDVDEDVFVLFVAREKGTRKQFLSSGSHRAQLADDSGIPKNVLISLAGANNEYVNQDLVAVVSAYVEDTQTSVINPNTGLPVLSRTLEGIVETGVEVDREVAIADDELSGTADFVFQAPGDDDPLAQSRITEGEAVDLFARLNPGADPRGGAAGSKTIVEIISDPSATSAREQDWYFADPDDANAELRTGIAQSPATPAAKLGPAPVKTHDDGLVEADQTIRFDLRSDRALFVEADDDDDAVTFGERYTPGANRTLTIVDNDKAALSFAENTVAKAINAYPGQSNLVFQASLDKSIVLPAELGDELLFTAAGGEGYTDITLVFTDVNGDGVLSGNELSAYTLPWTLDEDYWTSQQRFQFNREGAGKYTEIVEHRLGEKVYTPIPHPLYLGVNIGTPFALPEEHPLRGRIDIGAQPVFKFVEEPTGWVAFGNSGEENAPAYIHQHASLSPGDVPEADITVRIPVTVKAPAGANETLAVTVRAGLAPLPRATHQSNFSDFEIPSTPLEFVFTGASVPRSITRHLQLAIKADNRFEDDEKIRLEIGALKIGGAPAATYGATVNGQSTSLQIRDDDPGTAGLVAYEFRSTGAGAGIAPVENPEVEALRRSALDTIADSPKDASPLRLELTSAVDADSVFSFAVRDITGTAKIGTATREDWTFYTIGDNGMRRDPASDPLVFRVDRGKTEPDRPIYIIPRDDNFRKGNLTAKFAAATDVTGPDEYGVELLGSHPSTPRYAVGVEAFTMLLIDDESSAFQFFDIGPVAESAGEAEGLLTLDAPGATAAAFDIALDAGTCAGVSLRAPGPVEFARGDTEKNIVFDIADDNEYELPQRCRITITAPDDGRYHNGGDRSLVKFIRIIDDEARVNFASAQCAPVSADGAVCTLADMPADNDIAFSSRALPPEVVHTGANGEALPALGDITVKYRAFLGTDTASTGHLLFGSEREITIPAGESSAPIPLPEEALLLEHVGKTVSVHVFESSVVFDAVVDDTPYEIAGTLRTAAFEVLAPPPTVAMQPAEPVFMDEHLGAQTYALTLSLSHAFDFPADVQLSVRQPASTFYEPNSACAAAARGASGYRAAASADAPRNPASTAGEALFDITLPAGALTRTVNLSLTPFDDACDNDGSGLVTFSLVSPVDVAAADGERQIYVIDDDRRDLRVVYAHTPGADKAVLSGGKDAPDIFITDEASGETHTPFPLVVSLSRAPNEREGAVRASFEMVFGTQYFELLDPDIVFEFPPVVKETKHTLNARAINDAIQATHSSAELGYLQAYPRQVSTGTLFQRQSWHSAAQLRLQKEAGTVAWKCANASVPRGADPHAGAQNDPECQPQHRTAYAFENLDRQTSYLVPLAFGGNAVRGVDYTINPVLPLCVYDGNYYLRQAGADAETTRGLLENIRFPNIDDPASKSLTLRLGNPDEENSGIIIGVGDAIVGVTGSVACPSTLPEQGYGKVGVGEPHTTTIRIHRAEPILLSLHNTSAGGTARENEGVRYILRASAASPVDKEIPLVLSGSAADVAGLVKTFTVTLRAGETEISGGPLQIDDEIVERDETLVISFGALDTRDSSYAPDPAAPDLAYTIEDDDRMFLSVAMQDSGGNAIGTADVGAEGTKLAASLTADDGRPARVDFGADAGGKLAFAAPIPGAGITPRFSFSDEDGDGMLEGGETAQIQDWSGDYGGLFSGEYALSYDLEVGGSFAPPPGFGREHIANLPVGLAFTGTDDIRFIAAPDAPAPGGIQTSVREGESIAVWIRRRGHSPLKTEIPLLVGEVAGDGGADPENPLSIQYVFSATRRDAGGFHTDKTTGTSIPTPLNNVVEGDRERVVVLDAASLPSGYSVAAPSRTTFIIEDINQAALELSVTKPAAWAAFNPDATGRLEIFAELTAPDRGIKVGSGGQIRYGTGSIGTVAGTPLTFTDADRDGFLSGGELREQLTTPHLSSSPATQREVFGDGDSAGITYSLLADNLPANLSAEQFTATSATATVRIEKPTVRFAAESRAVRASEGGTATLTLELSEALQQVALLTYNLAGGGGVNGALPPNVSTNVPLRLPARSAVATLSFNDLDDQGAGDDSVVEGDEEFLLTLLENAAIGVAGANTATITIVDNDRASLEATASVLTVTQTGAGTQVAMVFAGALTAPGGIEVGAGGRLRINSETTAFGIAPFIFDDTTGKDGSGGPDGLLSGDELMDTVTTSTLRNSNEETVRVTFSLDQSSLPRALASAQFSNTESTAAFTTTLIDFTTSAPVMHGEGDGVVSIPLNLSEALPGTVTLHVEPGSGINSANEVVRGPGDAEPGADYQAAAESELSLNTHPVAAAVRVLEDGIVEGDETFLLFLRAEGGKPYSTQHFDKGPLAQVIITDNDTAPLTVTPSAAYFVAGDTITFTGQLAAPAGGVAIGGAGALTFTHALDSGDIHLVFSDSDNDLLLRGDELTATAGWVAREGAVFSQFALGANPPERLAAAQFPARPVVLLENRRLSLAYKESQSTVAEGDSVEFDLLRSRADAATVRVPMRVAGDVAAGDLQAFGGEIGPQIPSGDGAVTGAILAAVDDQIVEGDEVFRVELDAAHAQWPANHVAGAAGVLTFRITDDDSADLLVRTSGNIAGAGDQIFFNGTLAAPPGGIQVGAGGSLAFRHTSGGAAVDIRFTDADGDGLLRGGELNAPDVPHTLTENETVFHFDLFEPPLNLRAAQFPNLPATMAFGSRGTIALSMLADVVREETPLNITAAVIEQSAVSLRIPLRIVRISGGAVGEAFVGAHEISGNFTASVATQTLRIGIPRDGVVEGDEQFRVELADDSPDWPSGYAAGGPLTFTLRDADTTSLSVEPARADVPLGDTHELRAQIVQGESLYGTAGRDAGITGCDNNRLNCQNDGGVLFVGAGGSVSFGASAPDGTVLTFTFTDTAGRGGVGDPDGVLSHDERKATATWNTAGTPSTGEHSLAFRPAANFPAALLPQLRDVPARVVVNVQ